jgi:hypothetical protein
MRLLASLESILDKSPQYYRAKTAISIANKESKAIPLTRYFLIKGLVDQIPIERLDRSDLEKKLLMEDNFVFTKEEYEVMADVIYPSFEQFCRDENINCVEKNTVKNCYLKGFHVSDGVGVLQIFCKDQSRIQAFL